MDEQLHQVHLKNMIKCFLVFLRAAVKTVIERLTHSTYLATLRMLLDRDRPLYSLLVALEVSRDLGIIFFKLFYLSWVYNTAKGLIFSILFTLISGYHGIHFVNFFRRKDYNTAKDFFRCDPVESYSSCTYIYCFIMAFYKPFA